jgi:transcriptional pleiotropic regulator of transition state genes
MKSTGIVRKVDELGRVVLPIELRRTLAIEVKTPLEIFVEDDTIILRNYKPLCYICGSGGELKKIKEKKICAECLEIAKKL